MKRDFKHMNTKLNIEYDCSNDLMERSLSKIFFKNPILTTFILHIQAILMSAYKRIKYIKNYQNPTI